MKIIPKFQNSGKAPTRQQIELNKKKLEFLNLHGVKVKIDGSWGPWQLEQYNRIKSKLTKPKLNWFVRSMIGAAVAENPAVMTASGWQLDTLGNWILKRTKESDKLADNLAVIGEVAITAPTAGGDIRALYSVVRHPILSAKTAYKMVSSIPRYVFNHLPYRTIDNIDGRIIRLGRDAREFLTTPIGKNPIKAVKARRYRLRVGTLPRTDVGNYGYYNTINSPILNIGDPIPLIRKRLRNRLLNKDYMYSYPNDGIGIFLDKKMYDADYLISSIPVKEYLPFKEVYKLMLGRNSGISNKIISAIQTPYQYVGLNMKPGFAAGHDFIKINKKALRDLGFDVPTTLSHEYNHALRNDRFRSNGIYHIPSTSSALKMLAFDYSHLPERVGNYLDSSTEIEARGTQLKNYFDTDVITPDMLKYASLHYVPDTRMDNNMYQFFSGIKDWDAAADYLSKFSLKNGGKL